MPRPLAEMDIQRARAIDSIAFDVDNTVTTHRQLSPEAYSAMCALDEAGFTLVAATGRPLGWCDVWAAQWPIDCAVGENGAGWVSVRDGFRIEAYVDEPNERAAFAHKAQRIVEEVAAQLPNIKLTQDHHARRCDVSFDIGERSQASSTQIDHLARIIRAHGAQAIISSVHGHAAHPGWDKANGIAHAAHKLLNRDLRQPQELQRWVFIGDSPNDDGAFGYFPNSVGVANVERFLPMLRHAPGFVTHAAEGLGFAEVATFLLSLAR